MRGFFYPKLAWEGIRKNKQLYFPYILTGCVMVMMYYILCFLTESPALENMKGGSVLMTILPLGCVIIGAFSVLFLFYTNSFLVKQRYREFGLYNILGMDKKNICILMAWESVYVALFSMILGLIAGIALSKMAELVLLNLRGMDVNYSLTIGTASLIGTIQIYGVIYLLLLMNSIIRVSRSGALALMQTSKAGEKDMKLTWPFALLGILCLAGAYYLAVNIEEPLTAFVWFFVAVLLVIFGTYLVFISGSVVFCRLLQKNKAYYYKPNHFVSVSSMVYRMKRNGAGLASICILLTMVLVMISSTASLYFGAEDTLENRCPNGINLSVTYDNMDGISDDNLNKLRDEIRTYVGEDVDMTGVRACEIPGLITEEGILIDFQNAEGMSTVSWDNIGYLSVISLEDYNGMTGENRILKEKECMVYCERIDYNWDTFTMEYGEPYKVVDQLEEMKVPEKYISMVTPTVYLVVEDMETYVEPVREMKNSAGDSMMMYDWTWGFDPETREEEALAYNQLRGVITPLATGEETDIFTFSLQSRDIQRKSFYDMYGSLFFLGIMLSIVFLLAAVLIIYYKQISEGYEDVARFDIMRKVGMTKREIRRSINSQMLTVFYLPLIFAGIHLAFSFPFVMKIFKMFAFNDLFLGMLVDMGCFVAFGIFYGIVYKITSGAYYRIVSGGSRG